METRVSHFQTQRCVTGPADSRAREPHLSRRWPPTRKSSRAALAPTSCLGWADTQVSLCLSQEENIP